MDSQPPPPYSNVPAPLNVPSNYPQYPSSQQPSQYPPTQLPPISSSQYPTSGYSSSYYTSPQYPPSKSAPTNFPPQYGAQPQSQMSNSNLNQFGSDGANQPLLPPQNFPGGVQVPGNEPIAPSAPTLDQMDKVPGYENVTFDGSFLPPPQPDPTIRGQQPIRVDFSNLYKLTTEDARNALLAYVNEQCCFGARAARNMAITSIDQTSAFHYTLETFSERRESSWAYEPYVGQVIDSPANGRAPSPWEISIHPPEPYTEKTVVCEVPHTASVKPCHDCGGLGKKTCHHCLGRGATMCTSCRGSGHGFGHHSVGDHGHDRCTWCHGSGFRRCNDCKGNGHIVCPSCDGRLQLKWFIRLKSTWMVHLNDHIVERTPMPDDLVRNVTGQVAFEEDLPRAWPITNFPDMEVNTASERLITQHNAIQEAERVISQRQKVRIVPVGQVNYNWKNKIDAFFVYGFENKVHAPNYPQKCCWGCTIL